MPRHQREPDEDDEDYEEPTQQEGILYTGEARVLRAPRHEQRERQESDGE